MAAHIRVELTGPSASNGRIWFVDHDGTETEISHCCTGIDIHADVNGITTATLHVINVQGHVSAELTELLVTRLNTQPPWWKRTLRDTILRGYTSRRYTSA